MRWIDTLCYLSRAKYELSHNLTEIVNCVIDKRYGCIDYENYIHKDINFITHYKCAYKKLILTTILKSIRIKYVSYWGDLRNAKEDKEFLGILYNLIDMRSDDHTQDDEVIEYISGLSPQYKLFDIDIMPNTIPFIVKNRTKQSMYDNPFLGRDTFI